MTAPAKDHRIDRIRLDSSAQLMTQFTARLSRQLSQLRSPVAVGPTGSRPTLVVVAHGSRDPRALATNIALVDRIRALRPGLRVALGHLELAEPLLADLLASHPPGEVVLAPLLLGRGYHVRHDLPAAAQAAPQLRTARAAALGPHRLLVGALADRLAQTPNPYGPYAPDAVVLAAAGSRDPRSAADAEGTAALLSARLGGVPVLPGYASATGPTVPEALAALRARGAERPVVAAYFTAPGHFATRCAEAAGGLPVSAPLGAHPALARLLLARYDEALATLPADAHHPLPLAASA